ASLQARHHLIGDTRHLLYIGPGWPEHDGLRPGVEEALDPDGAYLRWTKGTVGVHVKLRAVIGVGKGPELLAATLAIRANADVHELASIQSVGGFASRLGITAHFLPGLTKRLGGTLTASNPAIGFLGTTLEHGVSPAPHEDRDAGFLERLRFHADVVHVMVATVERHLWLSPQLVHDGEVLP